MRNPNAQKMECNAKVVGMDMMNGKENNEKKYQKMESD